MHYPKRRAEEERQAVALGSVMGREGDNGDGGQLWWHRKEESHRIVTTLKLSPSSDAMDSPGDSPHPRQLTMLLLNGSLVNGRIERLPINTRTASFLTQENGP